MAPGQSDESYSINKCHCLRGLEYIISLEVHPGHFILEVQDRRNTDQWRDTFDINYVENITRKTGNFKPYNVFTRMLANAININNDSVSVDLLTYSDLEAMRNKRAGIQKENNSINQVASQKRYFILKYFAEFDNVHYPLPLTYIGKPNPYILQESIRQLKEEIKVLKNTNSKEQHIKAFKNLQQDYDSLCHEKQEVEIELVELRRELSNSKHGSLIKERKALKSMVQHLENELMVEKTKYQKSASKRNHEYQNLLNEVEDLKISETNLKTRLKSLTNELSSCKKNNSSKRIFKSTSRDNSLDRMSVLSASSNNSRHSSTSGKRNVKSSNTTFERLSRPKDRNEKYRVNSRDSSLSSNNSKEGFRTSINLHKNGDKLKYSKKSFLKGRSNSDLNINRSQYSISHRSSSWDRKLNNANSRSNSRERTLHNRSRTRSLDNNSLNTRSQSPSASVSSCSSNKRFDPSAYIKERERKIKESSSKQNRSRVGRSKSLDKKVKQNDYYRKPPPFIQSVGSSVESLSDVILSDHSDGLSRVSRLPVKNAPSSPDLYFSEKSHSDMNNAADILSSTPEKPGPCRPSIFSSKMMKDPVIPNSKFYDRSREIAEIDERLNKVMFMMDNLT